MPVSPLPENPSLENLRHRAKGLLEEVRAGRPEALARIREFHPKGEAAAAALVLSGAQLVLARSYGFSSWPKLKRHVETIAPFRFDPTADVENAPGSAADTFVRLACLDYGRWQRSDLPKAQAMVEAEPAICASSIFAASAAGDVPAARAMLDRQPELARARGGPFGWEPLLYACYSRLGDSARRSTSTLEVARLLLERGADPNAGFLWQGNLPPFTALTGAFGEGEGGASQPAHPRRDELARLLLDAGADPNDGQTLYNRHFREEDGHLRLLFEYGLSGDRGGPWYRRFSDRLTSPARLLVEELWSAARRGFAGRVRLLVEHGADVNMPGLRDGRTPYEAAVLAGNAGIAAYLRAHGAREVPLDPGDAFAAAVVSGRREEALSLLKKHPGLPGALGLHGRMQLLQRAVEAAQLDGVRLMAELGFEISGITRHDGVGVSLAATPLHNAAWIGNLPMVRLLIELGADPNLRDPNHDATPLGWAEYNGQTEVARYLAEIAGIESPGRRG
ncbi:MAG: ankyrin repeat domain-containing protein [Thermoanaerobaculia bacterium]